MLLDPEVDLTRLVPLCIHGDGAVMKRDDEVFVWSISSFFGSMGSVKDVLLFKYPLCIIPERLMRSENVPLSLLGGSLCFHNFVKASGQPSTPGPRSSRARCCRCDLMVFAMCSYGESSKDRVLRRGFPEKHVQSGNGWQDLGKWMEATLWL